LAIAIRGIGLALIIATVIKKRSAKSNLGRPVAAADSLCANALASHEQASLNPCAHDLGWLLSPLSQHRFMREYWERKPCIITREQKGYYEDLLSLSDLDTLIASHNRLPGLRLVKAKTDIEVQRYSPDYAQVGQILYGTVNLERVLSEHEAGATIILEGVHRSWTPLTGFCRRLESTLNHPIQANLYLTPRAAQGFEVHYDTHDVFVIQVMGQKRWRIFPPHLKLPLRSQPFTGGHDASAKPLQELKLSQGDLLYIPRGYPHEAMTQSKHPSAHITVGVVSYTWCDLFQQTIRQLCEREPTFRKSVSIGLRESKFPREGKKQINKLVKLLRRPRVWEKSMDSLLDYFVSTRDPILHGHLLEQIRGDKLDLSSVVKIRAGLLFRIQTSGEDIILIFHGKSMRFPDYTATAIHFIVTTREFKVGSIPDCIDAPGKLVLVRRLLKEGFLSRSRPR
jgi:hypothetical protein